MNYTFLLLFPSVKSLISELRKPRGFRMKWKMQPNSPWKGLIVHSIATAQLDRGAANPGLSVSISVSQILFLLWWSHTNAKKNQSSIRICSAFDIDNIHHTVFHITFALFADDPPANFTVPPNRQQAPTLVSELDSLNQGVVKSGVISPGEELFKNVIDECQQWQRRSASQLNKVYTFNLAIKLLILMLSELVKLSQCNVLFYLVTQAHEQETFSLEKAIMNLQTELHKVQMENENLSDLRWTLADRCMSVKKV